MSLSPAARLVSVSPARFSTPSIRETKQHEATLRHTTDRPHTVAEAHTDRSISTAHTQRGTHERKQWTSETRGEANTHRERAHTGGVRRHGSTAGEQPKDDRLTSILRVLTMFPCLYALHHPELVVPQHDHGMHLIWCAHHLCCERCDVRILSASEGRTQHPPLSPPFLPPPVCARLLSHSGRRTRAPRDVRAADRDPLLPDPPSLSCIVPSHVASVCPRSRSIYPRSSRVRAPGTRVTHGPNDGERTVACGAERVAMARCA